MRQAFVEKIRGLSRDQKSAIILVLDGLIVPVALLLCLVLQTNSLNVDPILRDIWVIAPTLMVAAALLSWLLGIHRIRLKNYDMGSVAVTALQGCALFVIAALSDLVLGLALPASGWAVFAMLFSVLAVVARILMLHLLIALYQSDEHRVRVLVYGAGLTGVHLAKSLRTHDGLRPVAFVDDNPALQGLRLAGLTVARPSQIPDLVERHGIQLALMAMPSTGRAKQSQIARRLQKLGLEVQAVPSFAQMIDGDHLVENLTPVAPCAFLGRARLRGALTGLDKVYGGRTVMVTGAGGTIGSELCRQLLTLRPRRLVLFDLSEYALYTAEMELRPLAQEVGVELVPVLGSVTNAALLRRVLGAWNPEIVLHAAAYKHVPLVEANPVAGLANNVLGTEAVARAAQAAGVGRFVLISSDKAVRPTNVMGASKRLSEMVVQDLASRSRGTVFSMVRFGNVLGSSGSVIPLFQEQIARGGPVTITGSEVTRYFMTVEEAVQLVLRAGGMAAGGEVFLLDMGRPVKIAQLARQVIEAMGHTVRDADNPAGDIEIVDIGLRPGEKVHEELLIREGAMTTQHEKIFFGREDFPSEVEIAAILKGLREAVQEENTAKATGIVARWVEGYGAQAAEAART